MSDHAPLAWHDRFMVVARSAGWTVLTGLLLLLVGLALYITVVVGMLALENHRNERRFRRFESDTSRLLERLVAERAGRDAVAVALAERGYNRLRQCMAGTPEFGCAQASSPTRSYVANSASRGAGSFTECEVYVVVTFTFTGELTAATSRSRCIGL